MVLVPQVVADEGTAVHLKAVLSKRVFSELQRKFPAKLEDWDRLGGASAVIAQLHNVFRKTLDYRQALSSAAVAILAVVAAAWPYLSFAGFQGLRDLRLALADLAKPEGGSNDLERAYSLLQGRSALSVRDFGGGDWSPPLSLVRAAISLGESFNDFPRREEAPCLRYAVKGFRVLIETSDGIFERRRLASAVVSHDDVVLAFPCDKALATRLLAQLDPEEYPNELGNGVNLIPLL